MASRTKRSRGLPKRLRRLLNDVRVAIRRGFGGLLEEVLEPLEEASRPVEEAEVTSRGGHRDLLRRSK
jgi:hypothetical protein